MKMKNLFFRLLVFFQFAGDENLQAINYGVKKFANMVEQTREGYALFTFGHAESHCPVPPKSWELIHARHTTQRDLI